MKKTSGQNARRFAPLALICLLVLMCATLAACSRGTPPKGFVNEYENAVIGDGSPALYGIIGDTNVHYAQGAYGDILNGKGSSQSLTAWKGDMALSQIALISENAIVKNVRVAASDFASGGNVISSENISASFVDETLAYTGLPSGTKPSDTPSGTEDKASVPDVISGRSLSDIPRNGVKSIWVEICVPKTAKAGTYEGSIEVSADDVNSLTFAYTLEVLDITLPDASRFEFDAEFWQYPYSVAEYYGVEPFSAEHIAILKKHMAAYRDLGAHAITCSVIDEAWGGQTYSKNDIRYPSMVKWTKKADGSFAYDYTQLDAWISLNRELGIGDKIVLYSIASWSGQIRFYDEAKGKTMTVVPTLGSANWTAMWKDFLQNIIRHLEDNGWFDFAYMGVDERGYNEATLDLISSVKGSNGKPLKTAGAFNSISNSAKLALANRIDDLSVSSITAKEFPQAFEKLVADRRAAGKKTTIYTCTTHFPNSLALSMPGESYQTAMFCGAQNADGFMRWAFDAWVEDPLKDTTHWNYEAGDCFLVYPGDADNGFAPRMSVRLSKLSEGIRDVNKLKYLASLSSELAADVQAIFAKARVDYTFSTYKGAKYATDETLQQLPADMAEIKEAINTLTKKYLSNANGAL